MLRSDISTPKNGSWSFAQEDAVELFVLTKSTTPEATVLKTALSHLEEPVPM